MVLLHLVSKLINKPDKTDNITGTIVKSLFVLALAVATVAIVLRRLPIKINIVVPSDLDAKAYIPYWFLSFVDVIHFKDVFGQLLYSYNVSTGSSSFFNHMHDLHVQIN